MTVGPILHSIRTLQRAVRMASACTGLRAANSSRCFDRRARLLNCCVRPQVCTIRPAVASREYRRHRSQSNSFAVWVAFLFSVMRRWKSSGSVSAAPSCVSRYRAAPTSERFSCKACVSVARESLLLVAPCDPTCVSPAHYTTVRSRPMRFHRPLAACSPVLSRCTRTWITKSSRKRSEFTSGTKPDFLKLTVFRTRASIDGHGRHESDGGPQWES